MQAGLYNKDDNLIYNWEYLIKSRKIEIEYNKIICREWDIEGKLIIPEGIKHINKEAFEFCKKIEKIELSGDIKTIGESAFHSCIELKEINLPNTIETIGNYAFENCKNLTKINLPNSINKISCGLFECCNELTEIEMPENIKQINDYAFYGCENLKKVILSKKIQSIGEEVFSECNNLTKIIYPGSKEQFKKISGWKNIFDGNKLTIDDVIFQKTLEELINEGKSLREANIILKQQEDIVK